MANDRDDEQAVRRDTFAKVGVGVTTIPPNALLAVGTPANVGFQVDASGNVLANTVEATALGLKNLAPSSAVMTNASGALVTATLPVAQGGTGTTTLAGVLKGNGAGPVTPMLGATNMTARWTDPQTLGVGVLSDNGAAVGVNTPVIPAGAQLAVGPNADFRVDGAGNTFARTLVTASNLGVGGQLVVDGSATIPSLAVGNNATIPSLAAGGVTATKLDVTGDVFVSGVIVGNNPVGGGAASLRGYGTASPATFSFKYDNANFGRSERAIQIWCSTDNIYKTFIVEHPTDRARYLIHATLEGPEGAVYYRGTARLERGRAEVALPPYFEAFTRPDGRTILLTNIDGFDALAVRTQAGAKIANGVFVVESNNPASAQAFDWEVKAVRADGPPLQVEPHRDEVDVRRFGPYTYRADGGDGQRGERSAR